METSAAVVALVGGASREDLVRAEQLLAQYLDSFCESAATELQEQREFMRSCGMSLSRSQHAREVQQAEMADLRRLLSRLGRIRRDPARQARRELRRLMAMLEHVPFEQLVVTANAVIVSVRALAREDPASPAGEFEVHLPSPHHDLAPVFVTPSHTESLAVVFTRGGRHGACRGEAEAIVEMCAERADLAGLILTALSWARRNLP